MQHHRSAAVEARLKAREEQTMQPQQQPQPGAAAAAAAAAATSGADGGSTGSRGAGRHHGSTGEHMTASPLPAVGTLSVEQWAERLGSSADSAEFMELAMAACEEWHAASALLSSSGGEGARPLTTEELAGLQAGGNSATDWNRVWVRESVSQLQTARITNCCFAGQIVLLGDLRHAVEVSPGVTLPAGLRNTSFAGTVVLGNDVLVQDTTVVSNTILRTGAVVLSCGVVSCPEQSTYGNGEAILVGPETGGREVSTFFGMTFQDFAFLALNRGTPADMEYVGSRVQDLASRIVCGANVLGSNSRLVQCKEVKGVFVHENAVIHASHVSNATVFSTVAEPVVVRDDAQVHNAIIYPGATVTQCATVRSAVLLDYASASERATVSQSVIGPDSSIALGECRHCLVGPFVGFHHEALLIAALWPLGRGNMAYGANVGSNHTGRLNDQEILIGEGVFFGLSTVIKYPTNLLHSPYTIIAAGTTCLPQSVQLPFSLIVPPDSAGNALQPDDLLPRGYNLLCPAWVLRYSPYTIERHTTKFATRRRSHRYPTDHRVWRPALVDMLIRARHALQRVQSETTASRRQRSGTVLYNKADVPEVGANVMTEPARQTGIDAYTMYIRQYALGNFVARVAHYLSDAADVAVQEVPPAPSDFDLASPTPISPVSETGDLLKRAPQPPVSGEGGASLLGAEDAPSDAEVAAAAAFAAGLTSGGSGGFGGSQSAVASAAMGGASGAGASSSRHILSVDGRDLEHMLRVDALGITIDVTSNGGGSDSAAAGSQGTSVPVDVEGESLTDEFGSMELATATVDWKQECLDINDAESSTWEHSKKVLLMEFGMNWSLRGMLEEYVQNIEVHMLRVRDCRARDWTRGEQIIPDYRAVHGVVDTDPIVAAARQQFEEVKSLADSITARL